MWLLATNCLLWPSVLHLCEIRALWCPSQLPLLCVLQSLSPCCRGASGWFLRSGAPQTPAWSIPPPWPPSVTTSSSVTSAWPCCWEPGTNTHAVASLYFSATNTRREGFCLTVTVGVLWLLSCLILQIRKCLSFWKALTNDLFCWGLRTFWE